MTSHDLLYTLCLLVNMPVHVRVLSIKSPHLEAPSSYKSSEILPYTSSKLADRNADAKEEINDQDNVITLFTDTKKEVKHAEVILRVLRVLQSLFTKKPAQNGTEKSVTKLKGPANIAWSYYDDFGK